MTESLVQPLYPGGVGNVVKNLLISYFLFHLDETVMILNTFYKHMIKTIVS